MEDGGIVERRDRGESILLAPLEVDCTATRRGVDDTGAFGLGDVRPARDDAVRFGRGSRRAPSGLLDDVGDFFREAGWMLLSRKIVKRADVLPADHLGALALADDLVAFLRFRFEDLLNAVEVRNAVEPVATFACPR